MAINTLKTLQEWVAEKGFQEGDFDVTDATQWLATCRLLLHVPYPGLAGAIEVS